MIRRAFVAALGSAMLATPIHAVVQQPAGVPRVGLLMGGTPSVEAARFGAFRAALEKLGCIDGQTVVIEPRYAMGEPDRFARMAHELVTLAPVVIACVSRQETVAAQEATRTIPIVFMQVNDPVERGVVHALARPGGNTAGFRQMSTDLADAVIE